jgi:hypothetical protein
MKLVKTLERDFQIITDKKKIRYILEEHVNFNNLKLKGTYNPPTQVIFKKFNEEKCQITFTADPKIKIGDSFTLFCTLSKHLEFDFKKITFSGDGKLVGECINAKIAENERGSVRYNIAGDTAFVNNFALSKNKIDLNPYTPQVSNKVIFHEFERKLKLKFPNLKIHDISSGGMDLESKAINKLQKPILVKDILAEQSFFSESDDFINYGQILGDDLPSKQSMFRNNGIKSILYYPIIYENLACKKFPIGYFYIEDKEKSLEQDDIQFLSDQSKIIIEKIKDANNIVINENQILNDISLNGASIQISKKELVESIIQRNSMVIDLVFKLQAPLRLYCEISYILEHRENGKKHILVGLKFSGKVYNEVKTTLKSCIQKFCA